MNEFVTTNLGEDWLPSLSSMRSVTLMLWIGLALLTVILFILMRTRWGQAKPLSKCIALSVMAHVLFAAYAYGTRMFFDLPPGPKDDVVHLTVMDPTEVDALEPDAATETTPWDQLADHDVTTGVEMPSAERVATSVGDLAEPVEVDPASELPDAPDFAVGAQATGIERALPADGMGKRESPPLPQIPDLLVNDSPIQAAPMDAAPQDKPPTPVASPDLESLADGPARAETTPVPAADVAAGVETPEPPKIETSVQQLADSAIPTRNPDALTAEFDRLRNKNGNQDVSVPSAPSPPTVARNMTNWAPTIGAGGADRPAPRRLGDGQLLPPTYRARVPDLRLTIARQHGGDEQTEASVDAALAWLAANQQQTGNWSSATHGGGRGKPVLGHQRSGAGAKADTAVTGLALLAMLAAGNTHYEGPYRQNVQRGLEYLIGVQRSDGNLSGDASLFAQMYCHGMASLALSEAFAMTGDQRLKRSVERAARYSTTAQDSNSGGWRYQVGDREGDMSQFGWQVMALKSAELADVVLPYRSKVGMSRFLRDCQAGSHGGLASYRRRERPTPTMTAEALSCRFFLQAKPTLAQRREATDYLLKHLPNSDTANYYYWYYGTLALFHCQGDGWPKWNDALKTQLLRRQVAAGHEDAGSWPTDSLWGGYGGRVYTTAMATLCLEVYYRYLPIYDQPQIARPLNRGFYR